MVVLVVPVVLVGHQLVLLLPLLLMAPPFATACVAVFGAALLSLLLSVAAIKRNIQMSGDTGKNARIINAAKTTDGGSHSTGRAGFLRPLWRYLVASPVKAITF